MQEEETMSNNESLIEFLITSKVLKFGEFTTKSGRKSPYFMNFGAISTGAQIKFLSSHYTSKIRSSSFRSANVVFGPAYKGIPLSVTIASQLDSPEQTTFFCFNRKEVKAHGEGGTLVGRQLEPGDKVVIVEDVVTAGTTVHEVVPVIRQIPGIEILGMVIAVDREEKIEESDQSTAREVLEKQYNFPILSLLKISDILSYLSVPNKTGVVLSEKEMKAAALYLSQYGGK
jgi:orotate phosphoribosyltransferase